MASAGRRANASGTGASRIRLPLPARSGDVGPQYGSRVRSNRCKERAVVVPMSKHRPFTLQWPSRYHRT